jgi:hypothetical protein
MENIVIGAKYLNAYFVEYPYGHSLNFLATSPTALIEGLKSIKFGYSPKVYQIVTWTKSPKFKVLTKKELEAITSHYK